MRNKNKHINKGILIIVVLATLASCSTKKKTWFHRSYHNTTAKYNGYFNGNESLKTGVKKLHKNHIDDYTTILPIYKTGELKSSKKTHSYMDKAIRKGSLVIQKHSIKIKGKEYCRWIDDNYLLVGKGYFYKGDFEEAIKTFNFIKNEYKDKEICLEASAWLARSYLEKKDFTSAAIEIKEFENKRQRPKKIELEYLKIKASYHLNKDELELALQQLKKLTKKIKKKRKKVRYNYIMAQIYQEQNKTNKAKTLYEQVLKSSREYEMTFNAKMNLARMTEHNEDNKKTNKKLLKMIKDEKNKEYLDQIYFTLAEIKIKNKDTLLATKNYLLSTSNSINNNPQKALSFLCLAEIKYNQEEYISSSTYYDSTIYYMDEDFRLYEKTLTKQLVLEELAKHLKEINLQDSLQVLASLPNKELNKLINTIIEEEVKKEKEQMNENRSRQQAIYDNNRNGGRGEQFGNNTSGGKWYFYNPATLSFGLSEFRRKWGKRKLEDDWRRKDKKTELSFSTDSAKIDSAKTKAKTTENKKDPKYYLEKIPKTKEEIKTSNRKLKESMYQAATIYKEELKEYKESTKMFQAIILRFPLDKEYASLSMYNIYLNQQAQKKNQKANKTKEKIIEKFPNSVYAKILKNPTNKTEIATKENSAEKKYNKTYLYYTEREYKQVLLLTREIKEDAYKTKYMFLRALAFIGEKDTTKAMQELNSVINTETETELKKEASYILETIKNPSKMMKANKLAVSEFPYVFDKEAPQMAIIIIPKTGADVNYLKTLISDYHNKEFQNKTFEISAMLLGLENHLVMIKTFENSSEVILYNKSLIKEQSIWQELNKSNYRIMGISFENFKEFYKNKDLKGYYDFHKKKYLKSNN